MVVLATVIWSWEIGHHGQCCQIAAYSVAQFEQIAIYCDPQLTTLIIVLMSWSMKNISIWEGDEGNGIRFAISWDPSQSSIHSFVRKDPFQQSALNFKQFVSIGSYIYVCILWKNPSRLLILLFKGEWLEI